MVERKSEPFKVYHDKRWVPYKPNSPYWAAVFHHAPEFGKSKFAWGALHESGFSETLEEAQRYAVKALHRQGLNWL